MRRLITRRPGVVPGSAVRQASLLLALAAALAGFFLLLNLVVPLFSSGPLDIFAVNPSDQPIDLPNAAGLLRVAVVVISIIVGTAALLVIQGKPLSRAMFRPSPRLALGVLLAAVCIGAGVYFAGTDLSGTFSETSACPEVGQAVAGELDCFPASQEQNKGQQQGLATPDNATIGNLGPSAYRLVVLGFFLLLLATLFIVRAKLLFVVLVVSILVFSYLYGLADRGDYPVLLDSAAMGGGGPGSFPYWIVVLVQALLAMAALLAVVMYSSARILVLALAAGLLLALFFYNPPTAQVGGLGMFGPGEGREGAPGDYADAVDQYLRSGDVDTLLAAALDTPDSDALDLATPSPEGQPADGDPANGQMSSGQISDENPVPGTVLKPSVSAARQAPRPAVYPTAQRAVRDRPPNAEEEEVAAETGDGPSGLTEFAQGLSSNDPEELQSTLLAVAATGTSVTRLENGTALIGDEGSAFWSAGTTTQQASGQPASAVFDVVGSAHTSYLRTAVGDVYEDGEWGQIDPVSLDYSAGDNILDTISAHLANPAGGFGSLPDWRQDAVPLFGLWDNPTRIDADRIQVLPTGTRNNLPAGRMPTSLTLQEADLSGVFNVFSSTFSSISPVAAYSWASDIPSYSADQLDAARVSQDPTYLQLPSNLPSRIRALAAEVTDGQVSPVAKAKALEAYLRTQYTYAFADGSGVGDPPLGHDPVDWFLFDHPEGTCGVFSSAFVVLARSIGIPARVVSGWVVKPTAQRQTVHTDQAHQWAEVAFEDLGWVRFEPTASGGAPSRVSGGASAGQQTVPNPTTPPAVDTVTNIIQWPAQIQRQVGFLLGGMVDTVSGQPVSGMTVEVYVNETKEHGGNLVGTTVARFGDFRAEVLIPIELELGAYQLLARAVPNDEYNESWSDPDITVFSSSRFELSGPADVPVDEQAVFQGRLLEDTGTGVANLEINVTVDGQAAPPVTTGPAGEFSFPTSFSEPGPHWVGVEFEAQEFLLDNTARLDFDVTLPTKITVEAPEFAAVGEEFVVSGYLRNIRGEPLVGANIVVQTGEAPEPPVLTDASGAFEFTGSTDTVGDLVVQIVFQGDAPAQPSEDAVSISVGIPHIVLDAVDPVARGDSVRLRGTALLGNYPATMVEVSIHGGPTLQTNEAGAFSYLHAVPEDAPLGLNEVTISVDSLGARVEAAIEVKSATRLLVTPVDKARPGGTAELEATLLNDQYEGVPRAKLRSSQGEEGVTDARGMARIELVVPDSDALLSVPVTFEYEGDDFNMPLSYFIGVPITPVGFNWLLWTGAPMAVVLVIVAGVTGRRMGTAPLRGLASRLARPLSTKADAEVAEELLHEETIPGQQSVRLEIGFIKPNQDLPDVWAIGEDVAIEVSLADMDGQAIARATITIDVLGQGAPTHRLTDEAGLCSNSWTATDLGEYVVSAEFTNEKGLAASQGRDFRVVDFREEIVLLYNHFLDWAREQATAIAGQSTPREVELILVQRGLALDQRALDELVSQFEEADYSEHPITRRHYERMYRACRTIVGDE